MRHRLYNLLLVLVASVGCAAGDSAADGTFGAGGNNASFEGDDAAPAEDLRGADSLLFDRAIDEARRAYQTSLDRNPANGRAAAGVAITDILLLPYSPSVTTLLTRRLGATAPLDNQVDVIYGEQGFFYFLARGVPWEDGQSTAGIKTLLIDRLPWRRQQLDTVDGFVTGLSHPVSLLAGDLVDFADDLARIEDNLQTAIDDETFTTILLPGTVFHDASLDLVLGKSELSALRATVAGLRSAIYFFGAYEHGWTLERALGESVWREVIDDSSHPDHVDGATAIDYQLAHLNETLGRSIDAPGLLDKSGEAFQQAVAALVDTIEFGLRETGRTAFNWSGVDAATAEDVTAFLETIGDAVDGPQPLPFTEPQQTLDLRPIFEDGRTVPDGSDLLTLQTYEGEFGESVDEVAVDGDTMDALSDGVLDPPPNSEPPPELLIGDDIDRLFDTVTTDVSNDVDRAVSGSF